MIIVLAPVSLYITEVCPQKGSWCLKRSHPEEQASVFWSGDLLRSKDMIFPHHHSGKCLSEILKNASAVQFKESLKKIQ